MLISTAFAQETAAVAEDLTMVDYFFSMLPMILIVFVFYFLLLRPQQKRLKEHVNMVQSLRKGDKIVTGGGLIGKVTKILDDEEVEVELSKGVKVRVVRSTITSNLSKSVSLAPDHRQDDKAA